MIPVMISAPWIPINQSKLQINKEISTAISVSDASTSGHTASLINSGTMRPVVCSSMAFITLIDSITTSSGISS